LFDNGTLYVTTFFAGKNYGEISFSLPPLSSLSSSFFSLLTHYYHWIAYCTLLFFFIKLFGCSSSKCCGNPAHYSLLMLMLELNMSKKKGIIRHLEPMRKHFVGVCVIMHTIGCIHKFNYLKASYNSD